MTRKEAYERYADIRSAHMWQCKRCVTGSDCDTKTDLDRRVAEYHG